MFIHMQSVYSHHTMRTIFQSSDVDIFNQPARIIIAGSSNSGKTQLTSNLALKYANKFDLTIICGTTHHDLEKSVINTRIKIFADIVNPFDYVDEYNKSKGLLYILDDCFLEASQNRYVVDAFTKGRHSNISIIFITQNLFFSGKHARNISLNASHYILTKNRDIGQVELLGKQIFGKNRAKDFGEIYKKALSLRNYGYLLIDIAVTTSEELQLRTNIVGEVPFELIYQW